MTSGTVLRIEVQERNSNCWFVFRAGGRKLEIKSARFDQITEARKAIYDALDRFQADVGDALKINDWALLEDAFRELDQTGNSQLFALFGGEGTQRLYDFLRAKAPLLLFPAGRGPVPIIELDADGDYIHFETLPLLGLTSRSKVKGPASLRRAVSRYLGMSAIIRRTSRAPLYQDLELRKAGKLPIKFFRDSSLKGGDLEADFFAQYSDDIDVDGPWPEPRVKVNEFGDALATFFLRPDRTFRGKQRNPIDQIHHISCHCYIGELTSDLNRLEFSDGYSATLRDLQAAYGRLFRALPRRRPAPPLAFLSACTSVAVDMHELSSFARLLLESHRGVIGTETRIPDEVAAEFTMAFYRALLDDKTVGESLHIARWHLLKEHNNPLGLVYTLYADPNLYVSKSKFKGGSDGEKRQA